MRWGIRNQLFVPLAILLAGVLGTSTWTALTSARRARRQVETRVAQVARVLGDSSFPLTAGVLDQARGLSGADFLLLRDGGERLTTLADLRGALPPLPAAAHGLDDGPGLGPRVTLAGRPYFASAVRLDRPRAGGPATLVILFPESLWRDALWEAVRPSLVLGGFGALAACALAAGVARRLSRRIALLERRTRAIAGGDFLPLPLGGARDELDDLAHSVNDMAARLDRLQQATRAGERLRLLGQVGAGLAHQLRNAVTGARLAVQLHARECRPPADAEALAVALRQLDLVEAHLKRFLDLGRPPQTHREPCPLTPLADESVRLLAPQCRHAHTDLRWQPPGEEVTVSGDPAQLRHLLVNLLTNAAEAAGPGGRVEVRLSASRSDNQAIIEVLDSGPGPPPDLADRLFEPFVTGKPEGVGLGLAVARQAAEAHGGSLAWDRAGGATRFRAILPLAST